MTGTPRNKPPIKKTHPFSSIPVERASASSESTGRALDRGVRSTTCGTACSRAAVYISASPPRQVDVDAAEELSQRFTAKVDINLIQPATIGLIAFPRGVVAAATLLASTDVIGHRAGRGPDGRLPGAPVSTGSSPGATRSRDGSAAPVTPGPRGCHSPRRPPAGLTGQLRAVAPCHGHLHHAAPARHDRSRAGPRLVRALSLISCGGPPFHTSQRCRSCGSPAQHAGLPGPIPPTSRQRVDQKSLTKAIGNESLLDLQLLGSGGRI